MKKYILILYRKYSDFKHFGFRHELNEKGELTITGLLKKSGNTCKYLEVKLWKK